MKNITHTIIFSFLLMFGVVGAAEAATKAPPVTKQQSLQRVEAYMNALTTIVADFSQVAPDGSLTGGKFFLKRPGKMRWQYDPPTPVLMTTTGQYLTYYDYQLEQVSKIPVESTLASFIAKPQISFSDSAVTVTNVETTPSTIKISLVQKAKPKDGSLVLEFENNPLQLRNMIVTDAQKQTTQVSLNNARFGETLDDEIFVFRDPRKKKRK